MNEGKIIYNKKLQEHNSFSNNKLYFFKIILALFFFYQAKFKNTILIELLSYNNLNINQYKEAINLTKGGLLEVYENKDKRNEIETKIGKIYKSEILFLIIPGGAYKFVSNREGFPIAQKFFKLGYSSAILFYSVYPHCYPSSYNQGLQAIQILSSRFKKIILIGFSAGGHLAGLLGTTERKQLYNAIGMILCYPVISFIKKVHVKSRSNFFGNKVSNNIKNRKYFSVENRVNSETLPTFIWTAKKDKVVPYQNSLYMIEQLKKNNVLFEAKIYEKGSHAMALADRTSIVNRNKKYYNKEVAKWPILASEFFEKIIKNNK